MARANYKQNPNLQPWSSNTINQRNAKIVKHAKEFFQQLTTIESIYLIPRKAIKQQIDPHTCIKNKHLKLFQWTTHARTKPLQIFHKF